MAQIIADRRDIDFVLHEQLKIGRLSENKTFADFNRETVDMIVSEACKLAIRELHPVWKDGDESGCRFDRGRVAVPKSFHRAYELFRKGGWVAMREAPERGGQGMPATVAYTAANYFNGANYAFMIYPRLAHGAGRLVEVFGTDRQKELFLENMYTGKWGGTMMLTEPQSGSDVGAIEASAVKNGDGTYFVKGGKIFVSGGEHDLAENIIHLVLARIKGSPPGIKGLSLFLIPKIWVNDDGSLGGFNDVVCTGIEKKMGIHGNPSCSMSLGGEGKCRGLLLGEENKGISAMFVMMNRARLLVGMQGFACASASYMNAVAYAGQRIQGRHILSGKKDAPSVPIIAHPDVRRQLMTMKVFVEGMRSLLLYIGFLEDMISIGEDSEETSRLQGLIDILTPVAKGYVTDLAFDVCDRGMQIFGGYGYSAEFPQEQLLRDCRVTKLYEGTNGIQAMDLLGRKLRLNNGKLLKILIAEINATIADAGKIPALENLAASVKKTLAKFDESAGHMMKTSGPDGIMVAYAFAHPFLEATGDVVMAWMLLWRAAVASRKLHNATGNDNAFYQGQILSARFFINSILPITAGKMAAILETDDTAVNISEKSFFA